MTDVPPTVERRFKLLDLVALFAVLSRFARQRVRIIVELTSAVSNFEVILFESFKPSNHLSFGILHLKEPSEGCVIGSNQEFAFIEILMEVFNSPDNRQQLLVRNTVVLLGFRKYAAEVLHDFFYLVLHLRQYSAYSDVARVCVQNEHSR